MGTRQCLKSNGEGVYQAALLPGVHRIEVEAPGFKRFIRDNVEIPIDDRVKVNGNLNTTLASLSANVANPCRQSAPCQCHRR